MGTTRHLGKGYPRRPRFFASLRMTFDTPSKNNITRKVGILHRTFCGRGGILSEGCWGGMAAILQPGRRQLDRYQGEMPRIFATESRSHRVAEMFL
jgi:hypothetical protein